MSETKNCPRFALRFGNIRSTSEELLTFLEHHSCFAELKKAGRQRGDNIAWACTRQRPALVKGVRFLVSKGNYCARSQASPFRIGKSPVMTENTKQVSVVKAELKKTGSTSALCFTNYKIKKQEDTGKRDYTQKGKITKGWRRGAPDSR